MRVKLEEKYTQIFLKWKPSMFGEGETTSTNQSNIPLFLKIVTMGYYITMEKDRG